jgi:hypothetical protein
VNNKEHLKVYKLVALDGFEWLLPVEREDLDKLRFDGTSRAASWTPIKVYRLRTTENGAPLVPGDFPPGCGGFTISRNAKEMLGSTLEEAGELLQLNNDDAEFWTLNVTRLVDALDEAQSKVIRSSETNRILMIQLHRFRPECLGPEVFKLSQMPRGPIYFSEVFVKRVKSSSLKGLDFKLVWAAN